MIKTAPGFSGFASRSQEDPVAKAD